MIAAQHRRPVRPSAYRRVLLVLAVLAGVFAMHGLAAGTAAPQHGPRGRPARRPPGGRRPRRTGPPRRPGTHR
ncbi:DUF6153 family protein, partial [Streptomyces sp. NPDC003036]|uniref:DUF6153 family protein n=1 Tax=Streptomyces sp. NPDC003036 TaxID=3154442 RepID=UPI0033A61587